MVNNATACPNPNYPNTAFCQYAPGFSGVSLGQYTAANSTWYASRDGKVVTQIMQDGTPCGNYNRETSFVYVCDPTATTPQLVNVSEIHQCYYTAFFATAAVCSPINGAVTGPSGGVGSTWFDERCGGGKYDLSSLSTYDLFWTPNASIATTVWFLRTCGAVTHPNCSATAGQGGTDVPAGQTAMLCQSDQTNPTGNDNAASFHVPSESLWSITPTGLQLIIQDGESCGTNFPRETTINFVCDPSSTTAVLSGVVEGPVCYYSATVLTSLVCDAVASSGVVPVLSSSTGDNPSTPGNGATAASVSSVVVVAALVVAALM